MSEPSAPPSVNPPSVETKNTQNSPYAEAYGQLSNNKTQPSNSTQNAMVWVRAGNNINVRPLKMSDMELICKSLPSPQHPGKFLTILQTHMKYAIFFW